MPTVIAGFIGAGPKVMRLLINSLAEANTGSKKYHEHTPLRAIARINPKLK
jgi:hypothetical protein